MAVYDALNAIYPQTIPQAVDTLVRATPNIVSK